MKKFLLLTCLSLVCVLPALQAENEGTVPDPKFPTWGSEGIVSGVDNIDELVEEARSGAVEPCEIKDVLNNEALNCTDDLEPMGFFIEPGVQRVTYVDGWLSHVGYYASGSLITYLEGPRAGCQLTLDRCGRVRTVNCRCEVLFTPRGKFVRHFYPDCHVTTGFDQTVHWY